MSGSEAFGGGRPAASGSLARFSPGSQVRKEGETGSASRRERADKLPFLVTVYLFSLILPFIFQLGPLRMSAYRFILIVLIVPLLAMWLSGRAGRIRFADIAFLLSSLWVGVSYTVLHGPAAGLEPGGIALIETMGAFLLARVYVRSLEHFYKVIKTLFLLVLFLLPFAVIETVTGQDIALKLSNSIFKSNYPIYMDPRWGLRRVQAVFQHPIAFGVFCSSIIGCTFYVIGYKRSAFKKLIYTSTVVFTAGLSLSSGPMTAMATQLGLISWDRILRKFKMRWYFLSGMFLSFVVLITIFANRSPAQILISFVAFRPSSAYNRLKIWDWGTINVARHPLFGVGYNEWERGRSMPESIDMFWLQPAIINGLPCAVFLHLAFLSVILLVIFNKSMGERYDSYRTGFLISMIGLYISGWTVHYWNNVYVLFVFLLGCGFCFVGNKASEYNDSELSGAVDTGNSAQPKDTDVAGGETNEPVSPYSRQKVRHTRT
ncbi:O-antigen ligase [Pseudoruegeria sp. HB172150]|uniref:O-antigen ligase family protein n=1 Tax=Pseudoruegeria sp. HB172150 TaxID=2721164 RepID=UPI0015558F0E|nr:O-antigen ligase domain-containing protein [Pseudoruegeria sp. HB172150]